MTNDLVKEYLISNYEHLKEMADQRREERDALIREECKELEDEIFQEYEVIVKSDIIDEVTKALAIDYETVYSVLEERHIKELFK